MRPSVRYQFWIVAAAGVIFFTNLGATGLWDMDEALYATCSREMLQRGNWIVPWFNGAMFPEKPPLMFWTMMGGFELFGLNSEFGARFFSALMGVGTSLVAFHLGRILFNAGVGLWAGLITASTIIFTISARAATVDSALTFFTALAFLMFVLGREKWSVVGGQWAVGGGERVEDCRLAAASTRRSPEGKAGILRRFYVAWTRRLNTNPHSRLSLPYAIAAYACVGVTVLGKGPVMLLPLAAMGLFLLAINGWRSLFRSAWWMRPFTMILVIAVVAVPWYVWVGIDTHWEWPKKFFIDFNLRPFKKPILGHGDVSSLDRVGAVVVSILYYFYQVPAVLVGFFPWSVFLGPTLLDTIRQWRGGKTADGPNRCLDENGTVVDVAAASEAARWRDGTVLASCWFGTWFVFWSVCKTKLPHYLLPAYPALALLTACFIDRWLAAEKGTGPICAQHPPGRSGKLDLSPFPPPWALRNAWISTILVGVGIMVAMIAISTVTAIYLPGEAWIGAVGLILVAGGGCCWQATAHDRHQRAAVIFAVTSVAFLTAVFGFAALRVDRFQNAKPMIAAICADEEKGSGVFSSQPVSPIAAYRFFQESTVFYGRKPVTRCENDDATGRSAEQALAAFLARPGRSYVITTSEHEPELEKAFPGELEAIHRERRFLKPGEMVVFRHGK